MKRIVALVLALMLCGAALAEYRIGIDNFDFEHMTDEDLETSIQLGEAIIQRASDEIERREQAALTHYSNTFAQYTVKPYFMNGFELLLEFKWTNIYSDSRTFKNSIACSAYQSGKELPEGLLLYDPESHGFDIVHKGDTAVAYVCYRMQDMSEITVYLGEPKGKAEDSFTINIADLETYKSKYD